jgi:RNase P protein component
MYELPEFSISLTSLLMLQKKNRLSGKQINWLLGRWRKLYGRSLVCIAFPQRSFLKHTQRSLTIPVKLDKRATMRNALKRRGRILFFDLATQYIWEKAWQLFFFFNKKSIDEFKQLIATKKKTDIYTYRKRICVQDFTYFLRELWKPGIQQWFNGEKK